MTQVAQLLVKLALIALAGYALYQHSVTGVLLCIALAMVIVSP